MGISVYAVHYKHLYAELLELSADGCLWCLGIIGREACYLPCIILVFFSTYTNWNVKIIMNHYNGLQ
jgi:hypothetical protein